MMLTHRQQARSRLNQIADGGLFVLALALAYGLRANFPWLNLAPLEDFTEYLWLFPLVAVLGPVVLSSQGFYRPDRLRTRLGGVLIVVRSCTFTVVGAILLLFLVRVQVARSVIILVGGFGGLLVYARHELAQWGIRQHPQRQRVLWVGPRHEHVRLQEALSGLERDALESTGEWDPGEAPIEAFVQRLHCDAVNLVVVTLAGVDPAQAERVIAACEREGVEVMVRPGLFRTSPYRLAVDALAGEPVLHLRAQSAPPGELILKQALDYLLAVVLTIGFAPLFLIIAGAIKLTSRGPIFFRQQRAGLNGQPFDMLKFRSMCHGAEHEQASLAERNELKGPAFKLRHDPRVTPLGALLRRHSLDELPQLWNVLRGEMSLVGPRPLPVEEVARIADSADRRRLSVKPGMTGLWQISGRSDLADFSDWVRLDLAYIDQWTLWLDLKILLGTIPVALLGRGGR